MGKRDEGEDAEKIDHASDSQKALEEEFTALFSKLGYLGSGGLWAGFGATRWQDSGSDLLENAEGKLRGPTALCLSGGGIRSATFSLGVLQGFAQTKILDQFDYLSTVSGGGYIGSWLSRWLAGEVTTTTARKMEDALDEPAFSVEKSSPLRSLRGFSNYMSPTLGMSGDIATVAMIFVRNLVYNLLFWIPFILFLAFVPWFLWHVPWFWIDPFSDGLTHGLAGTVHLAALYVPVLMLALWLLTAVIVLLSAPWVSDGWRELASRYAARLIMVTIVWLVLYAAFVYIPWLALAALDYAKAKGHLQSAGVAAGVGGSLFAVTSGLVGYWSRYGPDLRKKAYGVANALGAKITDLIALLSLLVIAAAASMTIFLWLLWLGGTPLSLGHLGQQFLAGRWMGFASKPSLAFGLPSPPWLIGVTILLAFVSIVPWFLGCNRFSLHALYGNRLTRAYLGSARAGRDPNPVTDYDSNDNVGMEALPWGAETRDGKVEGAGPFHVVNMTLNLTRTSPTTLDWQERKGASFIATPLHCGSLVTGYAPSRLMAGGNGMTLARAMTISGAAVSPNMGYHSSSLMTLLMTIFNIRLGWWAPNPKWKRLYADEPLKRTEPLFGLYYVLKEAFLGTDSNSDWLYLSDGGHFENLGLYEMVRRRCRTIVVIDAGCDGDFKHGDLHNALRKIRIDMGVPIALPPVLPGQPGAEKKRIVVGTIQYSQADSRFEDGLLIVLKPILVGTEPPALFEYAETSRRNGHTFPHHSTADQFFNETQFESYRQLGEISAIDLAAAYQHALSNPTNNALGNVILVDAEGVAPALLAEREVPDPALSGSTGIKEALGNLSPGQMVTGLIAAAGAVTAVTTVTHRVTEKVVNQVIAPEGNLRLNAEDHALIEKGMTVKVGDTVVLLQDLLAQINDLAGRLPPQFRIKHVVEDSMLREEIRQLRDLLKDWHPQVVVQPSTTGSGPSNNDLTALKADLAAIRMASNNISTALSQMNSGTGKLAEITQQLEVINKSIDASNTRRRARSE